MNFLKAALTFSTLLFLGLYFRPAGKSQDMNRPLSTTLQDVRENYLGLPHPGFNKLNFTTNEKGNRGFLFRGQSKKVAFFGGSTELQAALPDNKTYFYYLNTYFPNVYFENYSRTAHSCSQASDWLKKIRDQSYELIILSLHCKEKGSPLPESIEVLKSRFSEVKLNPFKNNKSFVERRDIPSRPRAPLNYENRLIKRLSQIELVYDPWEIKPKSRSTRMRKADQLFKLALKKAKKVFYIAPYIAWSADAHPGVEARWRSLYPSENFPGAYLSPASLHDYFSSVSDIMIEVAKKNKISVIQNENFLNELIVSSDKYFLDKWHFSSQGAREYAKFLKKSLFQNL